MVYVWSLIQIVLAHETQQTEPTCSPGASEAVAFGQANSQKLCLLTWALRSGFEGVLTDVEDSDAACTCHIHNRACELIELLTPVCALQDHPNVLSISVSGYLQDI